jgi:hypothetical protein
MERKCACTNYLDDRYTSNMDSENYSKYFLKPAVMAAIVAGGAAMYRPGSMVKIPGSKSVSLPLVVAGVTFIAAEASALVNEYLFPQIPQITLLAAPLHTGLTIGVQVGVTAGLENYISPGLVGDLGLTELTVFAAGAEVASTYLVNEWIRPTIMKYSSMY